MTILRQAFVEVETKRKDISIEKEHKRLLSWEISQNQYDAIRNSIIQKYESLVENLILKPQ